MASSKTFLCQVVTPEGVVLRQQVVAAVAPAADGLVGFLARRAPLMAVLGAGLVHLRTADRRRYLVSVAGGFAQMRDDALTILADRAGDVTETTGLTKAQQLELARKKLGLES